MKKNNRHRLIQLVLLALLAAMSIIFGKFLAIPIGNSIRISFENTPVIIAGILFGPLSGCVTGIVADLLGSVLKGYDINPYITLGAAAIGAVSGLIYKAFGKRKSYFSLAASIIPAHIIGSMLIKSFGLYAFYGTPFAVLLYRIPIYIGISLLEAYIIYLLLKSKALSKYTEL